MAEILASAAIVLVGETGTRPGIAEKHSVLRMMWAVDPSTGKLAARWIVDSPGPAEAASDPVVPCAPLSKAASARKTDGPLDDGWAGLRLSA